MQGLILCPKLGEFSFKFPSPIERHPQLLIDDIDNPQVLIIGLFTPPVLSQYPGGGHPVDQRQLEFPPNDN
jgi:hypothetical protein